MTVLSAQSIAVRCAATKLQKPMIEPFVHRQTFQGMSFGLSSCGYDIRIAEELLLNPGDFVLASSFEKFCMPNDLVGIVHDKSTWARKGLAVQNTVIEPGWKGYLTIELSNHGKEVLRTIIGMPICQVIFHKLDNFTILPYEGKYQNQEAGPQKARYDAEQKTEPDGVNS